MAIKKVILYFVTILVTLIFVYVDVEANSNYNWNNDVDFGDYDSYTDTNYGYNREEETIYYYDLDGSNLFGKYAYYSRYNQNKILNVYDDDPIVRYVPKSLFMQRGSYLHIGKEYGFYIDSHVISDGTHNENVGNINEVDVFVFDIEICYKTAYNCIELEVIPLWTYTYFYFGPNLANYAPDIENPNNIDLLTGVRLNKLIYDDFYYINLLSDKASKEGLVAPYPYCVFDNKKPNSDEYFCDRDSARFNQEKYALRNIGSIVQVENINMLNQCDYGYNENEDIGFAFSKSNYLYNGSSPDNTPISLKKYMITNIADIAKEDFFNELFSDHPRVRDILDIYNLFKGSLAHQEIIDKYLDFRYIIETNSQFYVEYMNGKGRDEDLDDDGLMKTAYYCFNNMDYQDETPILYFPRIFANNVHNNTTIYSNSVCMQYGGYYPEEDGIELSQNTIFYYDLYLEVVEFDSENIEFEFKASNNYSDEFISYRETSKTLDLNELENDTFDNGYFLEGYSDLIRFEPKESGVYYFDVDDLTMKINDINYTGEFYIELEEDEIYNIEVSGEAEGYRSYSFIVYMQQEFNLITDPNLENAGTEVTLNNGETNSTIMHVGYTRNLFLGENAPLDLYNSRLDYSWSSSNTAIATVSKYGTVFAKKTGEVIITACISNRYVSEITIYIYANNPIPGSESFDVALDISTDPSVPNGSMLKYIPSEIESDLNFGAGGFDIKIGFTRCIFILNGPSPYRKDYTYTTDCPHVLVSSFGTISINPNIGDAIFIVTITCTYKYDISYQSSFNIYIHQQ